MVQDTVKRCDISIGSKYNLIHSYIMVVLLYFHTTLFSEVRFLDLDFLCGAGGPGNPCYGFQASNCKFRTSLQVKCEF